MATDGPTPKKCREDIYKKGKGVCVIDGSANAVETWVKLVAKTAKAKVDWHYSSGLANVLHLGDAKGRARVLRAIKDLESKLTGKILNVGKPALFRKGVKSEGRNPAQGAVVYEKNGQLVMEDPVAEAVIAAIGKQNCRKLFEVNADRVAHFKNRMKEKGLSPEQAVITVINADDVHGGPIAEALMPGHDWQQYRDRGEVPLARGLAQRDGIQKVLSKFDEIAAKKLQDMKEIAVVVVDHGTAEVFEA